MLDEIEIACPYCGECIDVLVDRSVGAQTYVEDCQVCCSPMLLSISLDEAGQPSVVARQENE